MKMTDKYTDKYPEMFLCFLCERYKPVEELKHIRIMSELLTRDICITCFEKIGKGGISKAEALKGEDLPK
jgi:hypothetical protein